MSSAAAARGTKANAVLAAAEGEAVDMVVSGGKREGGEGKGKRKDDRRLPLAK